MILEALFEELPPGASSAIQLAVAATVGIGAYMLLSGYVEGHNCEVQSVKWSEYRLTRTAGMRLDANQRDQYAVEYAKANLACEKTGGPRLMESRLPADIEALAKEPRIMERAKEIWDKEHGLFGLPRT
jgi:hypothetical protein